MAQTVKDVRVILTEALESLEDKDDNIELNICVIDHNGTTNVFDGLQCADFELFEDVPELVLGVGSIVEEEDY